MPEGIIKDPVNNPSSESRFGVLQDYSDGHLKLYLKEEDDKGNGSRFFPAVTPVTFETVNTRITVNGVTADIEVAVGVEYNTNKGPRDQNYPMIDQYIKLAKEKLGTRKQNKYQKWTSNEIADIKNPDQVGP